ncbi:putative polysaccharide biosynthesis protein [Paraclostridium sordellii]|uniref:putative polysaccharide biosynthesis protein n=1 Tax=Paraclostridium sordellii TaxID=1505 RepID=UPI0005DC0C33|nr:polysaccharide biosynthesis protein [Paeniclostridium sordellii]CEO05128.1 stage V sporulation protein B [[Clostridium] sordellii] [Paeniclostridium sordellii]CEP40224.1 stage V sporulation protein B [[Clostridium] sordellii] [Paeniclostridium sordellii]CEP98462.1 stage V sporulation protein B [[Clostridium] sordellii] [Paeniclostridium sordellii]CEQ02299.1 stage V sporulation protein B [[Clostridium] sordellii] [Paeniclostridium sordellii]
MSNTRGRDSFLKGALILGLAGIIVKIIGAFFRIPLGNLIGAEGMGYYQAAYPVYTLFLTLATAGFPTALAKLVSEKMAIGDYRGAHKVFKVSYMVLAITGFVAFCIFFFGADFIVNDIMKNPGAKLAMLAISPALLFVPIMSAYRGYFQGRREMGHIAISQISEQLFRVVLGITLAYLLMSSVGPNPGPEQGAAGAIMGATIGAIASIIYLIIAYLLKLKTIKREIKISKKLREESIVKVLEKLLVVAIPITIGASVMPLVNMIDNVIVIRRLVEAGFSQTQANIMFGQLTGMAMAIVNLPAVITVAMSMSLVPTISQAYALGNRSKVIKETKSAIKITLMIVLPAAFGMASLAHPIMKLLYPSQPSSVGTILLVLTPCVVFLGLIQSLNGILQGMGKPMIPVICLAIGMIFKVVISYTLTAIPQINVIGSALGTVTAYFVAAILELIYIKKAIKMKLSIKQFVIVPLVIVNIMFLSVKLSFGLTIEALGNNLSTVISICVGGVIYLIATLALGGIDKEELMNIPKGDKLYKVLRNLKLMK